MFVKVGAFKTSSCLLVNSEQGLNLYIYIYM